MNLRKLGNLSQAGGVSRVILNDGPEKGVEAALFRTGTGLSFTVLLDRGMDIGHAEWCGRSLAWRSPTGDAHPSRFEPDGIGWLRTFGGGLLTTCGLAYAGAPAVDQGVALGLHGRIGHALAQGTSVEVVEEGARYRLVARGRMTEAQPVAGGHLELQREISAYIGSNTISVWDTVVNRGWTPHPLQLIYHCNLGWPLLDETSEILYPSRKAEPRDPASEKGLSDWNRHPAPVDGEPEQVFFHQMQAGADGYVTTALLNRPAGFGLQLRYRQAELPRFTQWRNFSAGNYVVGFEPSNCTVMGRDYDRKHGILQFLQPGERREFHLEFTVLPDAAAMDAAEQTIR